MKRNATMSLGELRRLTKDLPDDTVIMMISEQVNNEAVAVHPYCFGTSLDSQGVFLLEVDTSESVAYVDV